MSDSTINLISNEEIKRQYLQQYAMLSKALQETTAVLRALGVELPSVSGEEPLRKRINMTALVKQACDHFKDRKFNRDDVIAYIKEVDPERPINEKSVGAMISNMASDNGYLMLIEGGTGSTLGIYKVRDPLDGFF